MGSYNDQLRDTRFRRTNSGCAMYRVGPIVSGYCISGMAFMDEKPAYSFLRFMK